MDLRARIARLQQHVAPGVRGLRVTLHDPDGAITTDRVILHGLQPGALPRYCDVDDFPRLYPHGEIVRPIILEYTDEPERPSLLGTWLDAEPHE